MKKALDVARLWPMKSYIRRFQQQRLVGPVQEYEEGTVVVGGGWKGSDEDRRNSAGMGNDLQGGG